MPAVGLVLVGTAETSTSAIASNAATQVVCLLPAGGLLNVARSPYSRDDDLPAIFPVEVGDHIVVHHLCRIADLNVGVAHRGDED